MRAMKNEVQVVSYNPQWPSMFENEAKLIRQALGDNCIAVHHIGSTSIPGLAAKPIIDMIPVVNNISEVDSQIEAMNALGYQALGEYGMLFRRFFQKEGFNIHVYEEGTPDIKRYLLFKNWMCQHPEDKQAYEQLKQNLAQQFSHDRFAYTVGKDEFVASIDKKTGFNGLRIVNALTPREWKTLRYFRQHYFFDLRSIQDPYTWTFNDSKHLHFVLYQGNEVIGYAHIQLWPEQRAALRIIVVDEPYRNKGIGGQFLQQCERWLKENQYRSLHIESTPEVYPFYLKRGYSKAPFNDPDGYESNPHDIPLAKKL